MGSRRVAERRFKTREAAEAAAQQAALPPFLPRQVPAESSAAVSGDSMGSRQDQQRHSSYKIFVKMMKTVPLDVECTQISVKIPSVGKTIKLNVKKSQSVADIKADIEQKGGIPRNEQIQMHTGRQLEDNMKLEHCGLGNGEALHLLVLAITESGGDVVALKDTETLQSQNIKNNDVLTLHMGRTVQFFIKTWEGKTLTMLMEKSDTTNDVMRIIEERLQIKPGIYYLRYRGRALPRGDTLLISKIESDSTISVCLVGEVLSRVTERQKGVIA
ncbi:hypothetical protein C2845_PM01G39940 [Panicum miliaceum]|uniref:Ubiquitin-like domain-containing protein n=1 Tax=Panicum miliaceum TaxID=4540 RepID=A0A3L6TKX5_PANMI|nr:hypothetical protein C2845_PM01G39940 [Panicum miliaceum]